MDNPTTTPLDAGNQDGLQNISAPAGNNTEKLVPCFPDFKYRDTAIDGWEHRNDVRSSFKSNPTMKDTGQTVFRFPALYVDYCKTEGSVKGFDGACYSDYVPIDLDSSDLKSALVTIQEFMRFLEVEYDIDSSSVPIWFSGSKGFHIAIPTACIGDVDPSTKLPAFFKQLVLSNWDSWGFDMSIYDKNRLFRCENTINSKSGLYKIRIKDILNTNIQTILEDSKSPGDKTNLSELYDVLASPQLEREFHRAVEIVNSPSKLDRSQSKPEWQSLIQEEVPKGHRNNTAFDIARGMRRDSLSKDIVLENVQGWNHALPEPLPEGEIEKVVSSVFKHRPKSNVTSSSDNMYLRSDYGNANLFAAMHGDSARFDHTRKKWYIWQGQYWAQDETEQILHLAKSVARKRQELAMKIESDEERKKDLRWAIGAENLNRFRSMLSLAEAFEPIAITADAWESGNRLIQFENGVYDLGRAEFRQGRPADMNYQSTGFEYDPGAGCPIWEKAILEMMNDDQDMVNFLQYAIGYSLTGLTSEQCLFILTGDGCNGKSVVLDTLLSLLGSYANNSPFSTFEAKDYERSNDIARLVGARFVSSSESSQSRRLNEERIKAITGGDKITARFLYQEFFTYTPKFKIWLAVNTLPEIRGTDNGIWRRIKLVPFDVSFKGREDYQLTDKLRSELTGIMNWAIRGAHMWMANGLPEPPRVKDATNEYRSESDIVSAFIDEKAVKNPALTVKAAELYKVFREYCIQTGQHAMTSAMFGRQMRQLGYDKRKSNGTMQYEGIGFEDPLGHAPLQNDPFI